MSRWLAIGLWVLCGTAARGEPATCSELARAAQIPAGEVRDWALPIAAAITDAEARLDLGGPARVAFVDRPEAGAWYCAEGDVVYVSGALLSWAWLGRAVDGRDFLGFVVAHELAHRRFDEDDGALAAPCPTIDLAREARADRRAAFLLATARDPARGRGFSPFGLQRHEALASFFRSELGWDAECPALTARVDAVGDAVARMGELQRLYAAATDLAFAGAYEVALAVLGRLERAVAIGDAGAWGAVPELGLARAVLHLERAAQVGWCPDALALAPLDPSPCTLRCLPTLPRYTRLAPHDPMGRRGSRAIDRGAELATVRRLVAEAAARGVDRTGSLEACVAYLAADPERALALATPAQRPLFELQRFLLESPLPPGSAPWQDALRELARPSATGPVAEAMRAWLGEPAGVAPIAAWRVPGRDAWARLSPCPAERATTVLEDGWALAIAPGCTIVERAGRPRLVLREAIPSGLAATVEAWAGVCDLAARGLGEDDAPVLAASCPRWDGPGERWLLFGGSPPRALHVEERP